MEILTGGGSTTTSAAEGRGSRPSMESLRLRPPVALLGMPPPSTAADKVHFSAPSPRQPGAAEAGRRRSYGVAPPVMMRLPPRKAGASEFGNAGAVEGRGQEGEETSDWEDREAAETERRRRGNWVLKILRVRSSARSVGEQRRGDGGGGGDNGCLPREDGGEGYEDDGDRELQCGGYRGGAGLCCGAEEGSDGCGGEEEGERELGREAFGQLLRRASLKEARRFSKLSYLSRMAYSIPRIKPANLAKYHKLRFVTSSEEKIRGVGTASLPADRQARQLPEEEDKNRRKNTVPMTASSTYRVAAAAASFVHARVRGILPFRSPAPEESGSRAMGAGGEGGGGLASSEVASFVATTSSVTAVVAAREETKRAVAKGLSSADSAPCEWFVCDDDRTRTRLFVIQGSDSLASWQANLLFEPVQFEGLDVIVHRGIYEAAKGIYAQILPHVHDHLKRRRPGDSAAAAAARLRFTGHSLGGSLSLLVGLMLLIRGEVSSSSVLPVVTFGSPYVLCGGDYLLRKLGLPPDHLRAVMIHRDVVPRAFSCIYPDRAADVLRALNWRFRHHPCLLHQRLLYAPMGQLLIIQPEERHSPEHGLLPSGTALYVLRHRPPSASGEDPSRTLRRARATFLNTPHPLEVLGDRSAYGPGGAICRDHDVNAYLRSLRAVVRREMELARRDRRRRRRRMFPPEIQESGPAGEEESSGPLRRVFSSLLPGRMMRSSARRVT